ncbi:hypothetical protein [Psychromarinibacter sp. S121]|uniref:hypothetical protein n=1 Tax=Psychromarinibacter sp. S121 TaxID=3415127 RepID=UPI003C79E092
MTLKMPTLPKTISVSEPATKRLLPLAIGAGLLAAGAFLWRTKPQALNIPDPMPMDDSKQSNALQRAVRKSRDGVSLVAPDNLGVSVGRSMVIAGTALMVTRLLDELSGPHR